MNKRVLTVGMCCVMLIGCGGEVDVSVVHGSEDQGMNDTAIYLPGGAGIDFGKKSSFDNGAVEGRTRSVVFYFSDSIDDVSSAVDKVMSEVGYAGSSVSNKDYVELKIYKKQGVNISFAYSEVIKEGLSKKTKLLIWYRKDQNLDLGE